MYPTTCATECFAGSRSSCARGLPPGGLPRSGSPSAEPTDGIALRNAAGAAPARPSGRTPEWRRKPCVSGTVKLRQPRRQSRGTPVGGWCPESEIRLRSAPASDPWLRCARSPWRGAMSHSRALPRPRARWVSGDRHSCGSIVGRHSRPDVSNGNGSNVKTPGEANCPSPGACRPILFWRSGTGRTRQTARAGRTADPPKSLCIRLGQTSIENCAAARGTSTESFGSAPRGPSATGLGCV